MNPLRYFLLFLILFASPSLHAETAFDHRYSGWAELLKTCTQKGFVNYASLAKSPHPLRSFLDSLQKIQQKDYEAWNRNQKTAFWVNAYNAAILKMVADHYPPEKGFHWKPFVYPTNSIQQIRNVWNQKILKLMGENRSLDEIQNKILRGQFQDPRIHFALVNASIGSALLRQEPYVPDRLDEQLEAQTRQFVSDPVKVRFNPRTQKLYLSEIFKWYARDFEKSGGVIGFLKKYLPKETADRISSSTSIEWFDYEWSLNEKKHKSRKSLS